MMKVLKTIKKVGNIIYKVYSQTFNVIFNVLFGSFKTADMIDMYCNEHYYMTSGGVIMREEFEN